MSLVQSFAPHLPYLRRFSRALTGSQSAGDTYVRTALEALVAGNVQISADEDPKLALFKMFLGIWNSSGGVLETDGEEKEQSPSARIRKLTPASRQAFLLSALESLNLDEVAYVMGLSKDEAAALLTEAEADIEKELRTNVLIVEDEPIIAADIEGLVEELGHTVDSIAATRTEAVKAAARKTPGIVLADVQLADGSSGIDAVSDILDEHAVPIIFITAFPEKLLTGDKPEPAYLISKPFNPENVKAAISQALFFHNP
ncbi:response regulator receiver domain-containing protein [Litorimonas taeanensis]|uniref:Response regulator receiver domain-containing protein n=1 Tax=Litorimonas taeanensis TaxID=568099 RepID=A0A420WEK5_9PROT|nr:response regulator [Litorimonas taeanensis]RKQ69406.1 response regulator receiver domain-containing protein [Litorimonas taeanensis]